MTDEIRANIFELVSAREIASYWTEAVSNRIPYLGQTLFPAKKQLGLDLSWIKGAGGLPVALTPSAFDAKATLRDRIGIQKIETEMPFFREAMRIGEKDRQEINKLLAGSNRALLEPILNKIYDDVTALVDGASVQAERMIMQLLTTGKIALSEENRMYYDYDYKHPDGHKHKEANWGTWKPWSNTESNPVQDILEWRTIVRENTGETVTRAICGTKVWNALMLNETIRNDIDPIGGSRRILTDSDIASYFTAKLGLQIVVYDKKYRMELGGPSYPYFKDNIFTLIPSGTLGNLYFGTTPEESDLMTGQTTADVSIVNTGVAITTIKEPHPVNVETIVSAIMLPSFETIDQVFIAEVIAAS